MSYIFLEHVVGAARYGVPAVRVAEREVGEVAEQILTDAEAEIVCEIVALLASGIGRANQRLAPQIIDSATDLLAELVVLAGGGFDVDGRTRDHVDVVVAPDRDLVLDRLAYEHRRAFYGDPATVVAVPEEVGPVLRKLRRLRVANQQHGGE